MQIRIAKKYISIIAISLYMFTIVHNNKKSGHRSLNGMNIGDGSSMQRSERTTRLNYMYIS